MIFDTLFSRMRGRSSETPAETGARKILSRWPVRGDEFAKNFGFLRGQEGGYGSYLREACVPMFALVNDSEKPSVSDSLKKIAQLDLKLSEVPLEWKEKLHAARATQLNNEGHSTPETSATIAAYHRFRSGPMSDIYYLVSQLFKSVDKAYGGASVGVIQNLVSVNGTFRPDAFKEMHKDAGQADATRLSRAIDAGLKDFIVHTTTYLDSTETSRARISDSDRAALDKFFGWTRGALNPRRKDPDYDDIPPEVWQRAEIYTQEYDVGTTTVGEIAKEIKQNDARNAKDR